MGKRSARSTMKNQVRVDNSRRRPGRGKHSESGRRQQGGRGRVIHRQRRVTSSGPGCDASPTRTANKPVCHKTSPNTFARRHKAGRTTCDPMNSGQRNHEGSPKKREGTLHQLVGQELRRLMWPGVKSEPVAGSVTECAPAPQGKGCYVSTSLPETQTEVRHNQDLVEGHNTRRPNLRVFLKRPQIATRCGALPSPNHCATLPPWNRGENGGRNVWGPPASLHHDV